MKVKRDTTRDLFNAVLNLVKENGHYDRAAEIMDYYLPNISEYNSREDIELSNYEFDFYATPQFGSNEGIYIDCWLRGKYTETEIKFINYNRDMALETETTRSVGTFKTLKRDLESMQIMGELCGSLVYYASQYINENLDRYTPIEELEFQERRANCSSAERQYINKLAENTAIPKSLRLRCLTKPKYRKQTFMPLSTHTASVSRRIL